jgi:Magnesium chelatase, subunit ChlI
MVQQQTIQADHAATAPAASTTSTLMSQTVAKMLEDGLVTLARATATYAYPARFTLVAAMNPCPCRRELR